MLDGRKVQVKVGGDYEPIPMDKYTCQITDVKLVEQHKYQSTEMEEVLQYTFQILDEKPISEESEDTTRGRLLFKRMSFNMGGPKSWLNKLATAVFGRELTKAEKEAFDVESIVGKQIDVMTEQQPSKTDNSVIYNNVVVFSKTIKPLSPVGQENAPRPAITKVSVPVDAPKEAETVDEFLDSLDKDTAPAEEEDEVAKAERLLAEAKAKKATK